MAEKQTTPDIESQMMESYSRAEHWIIDNKQMLTYVVGGIFAVVAAWLLWSKVFIKNREADAQKKMFAAQNYFENDSFRLALNGDGSNMGFLKVMDKFSMTPAANLCHYYAGICYLNMGEYKKAIDNLEDYSAGDDVMKALTLGALGDAYMEMNNTEKGLSNYKSSTTATTNEFAAPILLQKAGMAYEHSGKFAEAKEIYERLKNEYPNSQQGRMIDAYIARVSTHL